jgi:hypothetical protein
MGCLVGWANLFSFHFPFLVFLFLFSLFLSSNLRETMTREGIGLGLLQYKTLKHT